MDAITAAVALISEQVAVQRLDFAVKMVRSNEDAKQGLVDLIAASANSGALYSSKGAVAQVVASQTLDAKA